MWSLSNWKTAFSAFGLIGLLVFSLPSVMLLHAPAGEAFSELYILDSDHKAEGYPFVVRVGQDYSLVVGVVDHLSSVAYYDVELKLRNASDSLPNATLGVPSSLPELYGFRAFTVDGGTWESDLTFRFLDIAFGQNVSQVGKVLINNFTCDVNKPVAWDAVNNGYYVQVFLELWLYDAVSYAFQFHNRFVGLWLNLTAAGL